MAAYEDQVRRLRELGPRPTGSPAHRALTDEVAAELEALGYAVARDSHVLDRWDVTAGGYGLSVDGRRVELTSAWPYSGETGPAGVEAPLVLLDGRRRNWAAAAGAIAVVEVHNRDVPTRLLVDPWDRELPFPTVTNPVISAELAGTDLTAAREAGVLAVAAIWRGLPDEVARGQYLPFTRGHQGIPAVWVAESAGDDLRTAAERGAVATLTLDATTTPGTTFDTVWAVSEGTGPHADEVVLVVTHSDGGNEVEENGHIGLLALARDAAAEPHDRTVVLVCIGGHLRIPAVTSDGQATTAWLEAHRDLWAGEPGGRTAVAGLVLEHLGARGLAVDPATGRHAAAGAEPELLYATTPELGRLVRSTWSGVRVDDATPVRPGPLLHFGEGEPLHEQRIPAVALVTGPAYLLAEVGDELGELVDLDVLTRQVDSFRRLLAHLVAVPDRAEIGVVRPPSRARRLLAALRVLLLLARRPPGAGPARPGAAA